MELHELVNSIYETFEKFKIDADSSLNGNKRAARRARVLSMDLEKMGKEFRKKSLESSKN